MAMEVRRTCATCGWWSPYGNDREGECGVPQPRWVDALVDLVMALPGGDEDDRWTASVRRTLASDMCPAHKPRR